MRLFIDEKVIEVQKSFLVRVKCKVDFSCVKQLVSKLLLRVKVKILFNLAYNHFEGFGIGGRNFSLLVFAVSHSDKCFDKFKSVYVERLLTRCFQTAVVDICSRGNELDLSNTLCDGTLDYLCFVQE